MYNLYALHAKSQIKKALARDASEQADISRSQSHSLGSTNRRSKQRYSPRLYETNPVNRERIRQTMIKEVDQQTGCTFTPRVIKRKSPVNGN